MYRVEDDTIRMWLPRAVGNGFLTITSVSDNQLQLRLDHSGDLDEKQVEAFLRRWWDLDRDMALFYQQFADDDLLKDSIVANRGARIVGFPDLFEALVIGILGQQVNVQFAYTLKQRLTEAYGEHLDWQGETWWRFPEPAQLGSVSVQELRDMQISQRKAEYLLGVAGAMADGRLSKEELEQQSFAEQMSALTALRGIGAWTAQYVCMKCLHGMDAFPAGDAGLQNAVKSLLGMDRKPTVEELQELATAWKGWEAYATWFLWMS